MATTLPPTELRVGLSGDIRRVPVHATDGLEQLQSRIAAAFNLSGPFRLRNTEAGHISSDQDVLTAASQAQGGAVLGPEVVVEAGEDALIDLERAHEATGALRWNLLKDVLAGLKSQLAEARLEIKSVQHEAAVLNERLCKESSRRQEGDASIRNDLAADIEAASVRLREEINAVMGSLKQGMQLSQKDLADTATRLMSSWMASEAAIKTEIAAKIDPFRREMDQAREHLTIVTKSVVKEEESRAVQGADLSDKVRKLEASSAALKKELEASSTSLGEKLDRRSAAMEALSSKVLSCEASVGKLQSEAAAHRGDLERSVQAASETQSSASSKLATDVASLESKVATQEAALASARQALEALIQSHKSDSLALVSGQKQQTEQAFSALEEASARKLKEACGKVAGDAEESMRRGVAECKESLQQYLEERLRTLGGGLEETSSKTKEQLQRELASLRDADLKLKSELQSQEQTWRKQVAQESSSQQAAVVDLRKEMGEKLEKMQTNTAERQSQMLNDFLEKADRATKDRLDGECSRLLTEISGQIGAVKKDLMEHAGELDKMWNTQRQSDKDRLEQIDGSSKRVTEEIRKALLAQSEFGEALDREQKVLIQSLQEGLEQSMSQTRAVQDRLHLRVQGLENNMDKVKGHLPILFAPPAAFR
mmetsp:Transcript_54529/g.130054  ORF Transcript_54529/g.130054 Transcript_54529/m.130054 type:complete len:658 (-) Transcript_54529:221-2194(-)